MPRLICSSLLVPILLLLVVPSNAHETEATLDFCSSLEKKSGDSNQKKCCEALGTTLDFCSSPEKKPKDSEQKKSNKWLQRRMDEINLATGNKSVLTFKEGLQALDEFKTSQSKVEGKIAFAYDGKSGQQLTEEETGSVELNLKWDSYPHQVRTILKFDFEDDNDEFEESVGKFELGYDYRFDVEGLRPFSLEAFALMRLDNIDELQIDERWRIGGGVKFEYTSGLRKEPRLNKKGGKIKDHLFIEGAEKIADSFVMNEKNAKGLGRIYREGLKSTMVMKEICGGEGKVENCEKKFKDELTTAVTDLGDKSFRLGLAHAMSSLEVGLSAGVFREFTDASVALVGSPGTMFETEGGPKFEGEKFNYSLAQDQRTVVSYRASLKFDLSKKLSFESNYYHVKRRGESNNLTVGNSDYYRTSDVAFKWKFAEKGELSLGYEWYFDNNPYTVDLVTINENADLQKFGTVVDAASTFDFVAAPDRFEKWSMKVTIPVNRLGVFK